MKRVAFIINRMNFRASSGHGIFMKGVVETLLNNGHFIDIICDGEPEENFLSNYEVNVYYPDKQDRLSYSKHSNLFQFEDSFNFEKSINFRSAITKALTNHIYDLVICNDTESAFVCYQMELYNRMRIVSYAHECATINPELKEGVFKDCYYDLIVKMMRWAEVGTLIQTNQNYIKLSDKFSNCEKKELNLTIQHYPLTDSNIIHNLEKDGLLFIGRHEDRKNPVEYMKVLAGIKEKYGVELKAKVMTPSAHVKKFEADFAEIGHTNYEIQADIVGDKKAAFIQSAKVAFMPYKNESFGIAVLEALRFMPTVVIRKYDWHYNFQGMSNLIVADQKELVDKIWNAYNTWIVDEQRVEKEFKEYQTNYETELLNLFPIHPVGNAKTEPRNKLYSKMKEQKGVWISLEDYFRTENSKGVIYLTSDIEATYSNLNWFKVMHTKQHTYVGLPDDNGDLRLPEPKHVESNFSEFFQ